MNKDVILSFEFASSTGEICPHTFTNPVRVISASTLEEVIPCLKMVQDAVEEGYYAAGYLSYESAPAFNEKFKVNPDNKMPLLWFGIFKEVSKKNVQSNGKYQVNPWKNSTTIDDYNKSIQSIKRAIKNGVTYQTNYTTRLYSKFQGDDFAFFEKLKRAQTSNYSAYLNIGDFRILSASPELFFHMEEETITTRPMKGTVKRGKTAEEDKENAKWLYHSEKNRAENIMIVDLLRNDLSVIAQPTSVHVPKLFEIEQYPTVHQMTSTVQARVKDQTDLVDVFRALFPCGSITGAPKISTMEIISDLETTPREVYCGAIGFITPKKEAIFNVPIRTVVIEENTGIATYGAGGGITWDSTKIGEYQEMLDKAKLLEEERPDFRLLESLLLEDGEYFLLEEHIHRLNNSAEYFGIPMNEDKVKTAFLKFAKRYESGQYKVRLLFSKNEEVELEAESITDLDVPIKVMLANEPIEMENLFYYHKTTNRTMYSRFQSKEGIYDLLLWNENKELTEFTIGNVVLKIGGALWTPPIKCGLLAGTYREFLIATGKIKEKVLYVEDLESAEGIWLINSVRKWLPVKLVDKRV
ncbi:aminodeoxychorismate synthase component I [Oceanobacillus sp. Castelsardo]|uniref:aminodeoxychorismate synthase component I n=1 Tax=Oceanobacillus sp. Castelsardo TaxID=1851204 RepID=UPI0008385969|nr:aminodeoxychorismate synthase component I [Oceanobacillus sp. Castelsardo]